MSIIGQLVELKDKLKAAKIPCKLTSIQSIESGEITRTDIQLGFNYPDELADKVFDILEDGCKLDVDVCAEVSYSTAFDTIFYSERINGGPKKYGSSWILG